MDEGWVGFAYACLEWLQGWGKWQLAAFFIWVGVVIMVRARGYPYAKKKELE